MEMNHELFSSHEHPLELCKLPNRVSNEIISLILRCSACKETMSSGEWIYTCKSCCNFNVHVSCSQTPRLINHPLHPQHPLHFHPFQELTSKPSLWSWAYWLGGADSPLFICGACDRDCKTDSSYRCSTCNFGTHIHCAYSRPVSVKHQLHKHPLHLSSFFGSNVLCRGCDICQKAIKSQNWFYRCDSCNFGAHLTCATGSTAGSIIRSPGFGAGFPPLRLEAQVNSATKTVSELQNEITDLQNEITDLKTKYNDLPQLVMKVKLEK